VNANEDHVTRDVKGTPGAFRIEGYLASFVHLEGQAMKQPKIFSAFCLIILLALFLGCASTPKQEGTGEYVDDSVITTKVKAAILEDSSLKVNEINVETFKGIVQLSGFVNSRANINKAVEVAGKIKGVKSVKNDMLLK
jgi:hypothetical protein